MTNTDSLFHAMSDFRTAQRRNVERYLEQKKRLERYKGSAGYDKDLKKIQEELNQANASAGAICRGKIDTIFKCMLSANAKRGVTAPSDDMIRILTAARMIKKPTKTMLDSIAVSLNGNALALLALEDIEKEAWSDDPTHRCTSYSAQATGELSTPAAEKAITALQKRCYAILNGTGANRARELYAEHSLKTGGIQYDPAELPREDDWTGERDFLRRELSMGYDPDLFQSAVNG